MSIILDAPHPVLACVEEIGGSLAGVADLQPVFMPLAEKQAALVALERARAALCELELRILASAGDVAEETGARDVAAWLAHQVQAEHTAVAADLRLATALDERYAALAAGMRTGDVSREQAGVIAHALDDLPAHLAPEIITSAERTLIELAADFRPSQLRRLGRRILEVVAPEVADEEEAKRLQREEERAQAKAYLRFREVGDGGTRLSGLLPSAVANRLRTYLDAYASPRSAPDALFGEEDRIPADRRAARAFAALLEHLDPAKLPEHGGDATTVLVTLSYEQLRTQLATAGMLDADLDAGANLTAEQARRLACTARIIPVVLGGQGEVLDLGRSRRLFTPAQRKAIRLRDKRCRGEGCTIPAAWTEAHHLTPWSQGGETNLADGICLCSHHHHRIHDHRYTHEVLPGGDVRFHRRT